MSGRSLTETEKLKDNGKINLQTIRSILLTVFLVLGILVGRGIVVGGTQTCSV